MHMQVKTIKEVYDWTVLFHTQMAANFYSVKDLLDEHNAMLVDYYLNYEKKLAEDLVGFKAITEINTLDTLERAETQSGQEKLQQILELEKQGIKQMMQSTNRHMDM